MQKFDDGTITVLEFFKLFNIDFVIHSPRQSVLPERVSDLEESCGRRRPPDVSLLSAAPVRHRTHAFGFPEGQTRAPSQTQGV